VGRPGPGSAVSAEVRSLPLPAPLDDPGLFQELTQRYLVLDPFVAGERRVDLHPLVLQPGLHAQAVEVAEGIVRVVNRAARAAHESGDEAALYRLPPGALALARASHQAGDDAALVRVDLLLGDDGRWRVCELNADCPGGHNEATGLPRLAQQAGASALLNPTTVVDAAARRLVELARGDAVALLFATGYAEDMQVCALLQRALQRLGARALLCPPTAPKFDGERVTLWGQTVGALYRFFPAEGMEQQRNAEGVTRALAGGHVRSFSSFSQLFAQSKLSLARVWARVDELDEGDRAFVLRHLPLTLSVADLPAPALLSDRRGWVLKRALGRVGEEVFVGELCGDLEWTEIVSGVVDLDLRGECWVAQRFAPQRPVPTPWGPRLVTLGVYVLDGRFVGYFARLSPESHVSHDALCVPAFVEVSP